MEEDLNFLKWKTSIFSKWKTIVKPKLILGLAKLSKILGYLLKLRDFERRGAKQCVVGGAEMETKHLHSC
jgi:hypothetical protein